MSATLKLPGEGQMALPLKILVNGSHEMYSSKKTQKFKNNSTKLSIFQKTKEIIHVI